MNVFKKKIKHLDILIIKKSNTFEEYFYDDRMDETKKGGYVYLVGGQAVTANDYIEGKQRFNPC